jgi:hypothetical protein
MIHFLLAHWYITIPVALILYAGFIWFMAQFCGSNRRKGDKE